MTLFVSLLLTVLTLAFIGYPFFKRRWEEVVSSDENERPEQYSRRGAAAPALKKPGLSGTSGTAEKGAAVDDEIENKIREIRAGSQTGARFCPRCGIRAKKGDRFCRSCGARLS
ncbi:MAG: hypothetical protein Q7R57_09900 [Dehalococcoidales bacterium]|nr:hypothetical protein [Dehalococcoidales bacterium]